MAKVLARLQGLFLVRAQASKVASRAGAERHRALLKQALVKNPDLLLLDEPFAGLGEPGCAELKDLIAGLARRGKTVILSSRSLCHARDVCARLAIFYCGHLEAVGTLEELLAAPHALRLLGDLLPKPTVARVLQAIREDLGAAALAGEAECSGAPGSGTPAVQQTSKPPAVNLLEPLLKHGAPAFGPEREPAPAVNHELLAALANPPTAAAPPPPVAKPTSSRHGLSA